MQNEIMKKITCLIDVLHCVKGLGNFGDEMCETCFSLQLILEGFIYVMLLLEWCMS